MYKTHLQLDKQAGMLIGFCIVFAILLMVNIVLLSMQISSVYLYKAPQTSTSAIDTQMLDKAIKILQE